MTAPSSAPTNRCVVEQSVAGGTAVVANSPAATISPGTAELWRQLAALVVAQ